MANGSRTLKLSILADVDNLKKNLDTGAKDVQGFGDKLGDFGKKAGKAFAVAAAAAAAYAGVLLVDGIKSAIEDEAAQAKLATTLENVTGATKNQIAAVEDYITQTALANGITDDVLRPSFDRLVRSTEDVTEAQKLQTLALDISAGTGKDLQAVSEALAKAHDGNFTALKKLGGGIDDSILKSKNFDAATAALAKTFENQATKQAETFEGKMARLSVAFDEAKETVGSYVLDALTPLVSNFVDKGIPAIQDMAKNLGETLGPAFGTIFKVIKEDVLPILITWWKFLYDEVIPAIGKVVGPILEGLKSAFDKIKKAISDNSEELQPFYDFLKKVWEFIDKYLAPLLGGAFKIALEVIGTLVAGLVTGFSNMVKFISGTIDKIKALIELVKNNPLTNLFGGGNDKSLKVGSSFVVQTEPSAMPSSYEGPSSNAGFGSFFGLNAQELSPTEYSRRLQELLTAGIVKAGVGYNASTGDPSPNAYQNYIASINVSGALDSEGTARAIIKVLNDSNYRGTGGANGLVMA